MALSEIDAFRANLQSQVSLKAHPKFVFLSSDSNRVKMDKVRLYALSGSQSLLKCLQGGITTS